jgi:hypothetical protein
MRYLSIIVFGFIFYHIGLSQNPESSNVQFYELMKARNSGTSEDIVGSPYLFKEWGEIKIYLKDSSHYKLTNANINIFTPSIDIVHNQLLKEIPLHFVDKVQITNKGVQKFYRPAVQYIKEGLKDKGFAEVHDLKNYTVLAHHFIVIQKPDPQAQILGTEKRTKYIHTTKLFILQKKALYPIKGKKDLKDVLKGKYQKAEELINDLDLDVEKTDDLILLLKKLES